MSTELLDVVRTICMALPEASERLSHGEPTFFVGKRVFTMVANNHHGDGRVAVWLPVPDGLQGMLIETDPDVYFYPPYVGVRGWVGIVLTTIDHDLLVGHIREAWRLIAPRKLLAQLSEF